MLRCRLAPVVILDSENGTMACFRQHGPFASQEIEPVLADEYTESSKVQFGKGVALVFRSKVANRQAMVGVVFCLSRIWKPPSFGLA